jgi:hypothetical protein
LSSRQRSEMAGDKVLVLGGTGISGICLLRELLHRNHKVIAYARNPSKIPADLVSSPDLEVGTYCVYTHPVILLLSLSTSIYKSHAASDRSWWLQQIQKGEMDDLESLSLAVSKSYIIISLLGPTTFRIPSYTFYPDMYKSLFPLMYQHNVKRIYAMGTFSIYLPDDQFSWSRSFWVWLVYILVHAAYRNITGIPKVFEEEGKGLDWTIYRIGGIPGGCDKGTWEKQREGEVFAGSVGAPGWSSWVHRSALAKWLVDCAEGDEGKWVKKLPAVSSLTVGKKSI